MTADLRVITTRYPRGVVVKLAVGHAVQPVAKFVVEARKGEVRLMVAALDGKGKPCLRERLFTGSLDSAVRAAERECECIRVRCADGVRGVW